MELEEKPRPLAWFGDPDLKARVIAKLKEHRAKDEIVQSYYQLDAEELARHDVTSHEFRHLSPIAEGSYKGCAVGCTLPHIPRTLEQRFDRFDWHGELEKQYGIPVFVARCIDNAFEYINGFEAAADFAVAVIEAIPVGADLRGDRDHVVLGTGTGQCDMGMCHECMDDATPEELITMLAMAPVPDAE